MANQPLRAGSSMRSRRKSLSMEVLRDGLPTPASSEDSWLTDKETASSDRPAHLPEVACRLACAEDDAEAVVFDFLNEGAANVVFSLRPYEPHGPHGPHDAARFVFVRRGQTIPRSKVLRRVLRISKGKPKTLPSEDIVRDFEAEIRPLFRPKQRPSTPSTPSTSSMSNASSTPSTSGTPNAQSTTLQGLQDPDALYPARSLEYFLLDHELVYLPSDVLKVLLRAQYAPDEIPTAPLEEQRGILLPDMSEVPGVSMTVEFKPKWLAASPNAPRSAYRCRTCALHAKRLAEFDGESLPAYICPLQLVHGNRAIISDVIMDKFTTDNDYNILEWVTNKAVDYLTVGPGHDLLMHLRHLQLQLDPIGVLHLPKYPQDMDPVIHRLRLAMTLRDCSLFLRITYANDWTPIEAKLVDLDFKSKDKYYDWHDKELKLVNGGWYTDLKAGVNQCLLAEGWLKWVPHYM